MMDGILSLGSRLIEQGKAIAGKLGVAMGDLKNIALDKLNAATGWLGEQLGFNPPDLEPVPVDAESGLTINKRPPLQGAGRQPQSVSNSLSIGEIHG